MEQILYLSVKYQLQLMRLPPIIYATILRLFLLIFSLHFPVKYDHVIYRNKYNKKLRLYIYIYIC